MKVLLVRVKYNHHSKFSGYDVIFNELKEPEFVSVYYQFRFKLFKKIINKLLSYVFRKFFTSNYKFDHFLHEIDIALAILKHKPEVVHVTHAHDPFKIINKPFFKKRTKFIGSMHLPYVMFKIGKKNLDWLTFYDKLMVLDYYSEEMFKKHLNEKVIYVPHPVDTKYFANKRQFDNPQRKEIFSCLFLGRFMRNLEMVFDIIIALHKVDPTIHFYFSHPIIYSPDRFYHRMIGALSLPTVHYFSKASDLKMLQFYQELDVLVMPMYESTANNVFLEAASCGMPTLTTRTNGLYTYLPEIIREKYNGFTTTEEIVNEILALRNDQVYCNKVSKAFYDHVMEEFTIDKGLEIPMKLYKGEL